MAAPYSLDLRARVVAASSAGQSLRQIAKVFSIAPSTVSKWTQRWRDSGSPAARPMGGKRPFSLAHQREWVLARVAELQQRGIEVSTFAVWNFLRREGVSFKKKPARQRAGSRRRGAAAHAMEEVSGQD